MCAWQPSGVTQGFVLCIPSWVAEWLSLWVCFAFPRQPSGVARGVVHPVVMAAWLSLWVRFAFWF